MWGLKRSGGCTITSRQPSSTLQRSSGRRGNRQRTLATLHHRWLRRIAYLRRNRCSVLLGVLFFFILAEALLTGSAVGITTLNFATLSILFLAVWAVRARRLVVWMAAALAVATAQAIVIDSFGEHWLRPPVHVAIAIYMAIVTIALLFYVLDRSAITTDKVFGAVAAYVLIAFSFASLFMLLLSVQPGAFYVAAANQAAARLEWPDLMYFSFTVLTSTGFGEITPVSRMARALVVIEQVLGVMYVAFLIARLANLYGRHSSRN